MRLMTALLVLAWMMLPAGAQQQKFTIDATTPEGQALQAIGQESDGAKKLTLMEEFVSKYPKHEATGWVYGQMQPLYAKAGNNEKVIDTADKILALEPDNTSAAHEALKAAEAMKSPDLILAWAVKTSDVARKVAASPKPADEDKVDDWKQAVDYAKQVDVYTQYALFKAATEATDPARRIALGEALMTRAPDSQYVPQLVGALFNAYQQAGQKEKAVALAEKVLEKDQSNEDMLLAVADYYMSKKDSAKVLLYAGKLVQVMSTKPKPAGASDADWEHKRKVTLGLGHWMAGMMLIGQNKAAAGDKELREALPFIHENPDLLAPALFQLGLVNFRLGDAGKGNTERILDAYRFFQQCAAMKSQFQGQAQKNITVIRAKYRIR